MISHGHPYDFHNNLSFQETQHNNAEIGCYLCEKVFPCKQASDRHHFVVRIIGDILKKLIFHSRTD